MRLFGSIAAPFRRHPRWTVAALVIVALFAVPVMPIVPECESRPGHDEKVLGELTPEFRNEFKSWLRDQDVYYLDIGGLILTPLLDNPFDPESGEFVHRIFDTSIKLAMILARESDVRWMIEHGRLPADYQIPEHVKPFSAMLTGSSRAIPEEQWDLAKTCEFIRAVALKPAMDAR